VSVWLSLMMVALVVLALDCGCDPARMCSGRRRHKMDSARQIRRPFLCGYRLLNDAIPLLFDVRQGAGRCFGQRGRRKTVAVKQVLTIRRGGESLLDVSIRYGGRIGVIRGCRGDRSGQLRRDAWSSKKDTRNLIAVLSLIVHHRRRARSSTGLFDGTWQIGNGGSCCLW
jgi:hypothetical protein